MDAEKIYFISRPSPTIGRSPIFGAGGGLFGLYKEGQYVSSLKNKLELAGINWTVECDDTEADIEKLIEQKAKLLVCAPGLRFQFYSGGFDKNNIVHLSMMDYVTNNVTPVINKIKGISNEKRT